MKVLSITQRLRRPRQILGMIVLASGFAFAGSVSISSPTSGASVSAPIHVVGAGSSTYPVTAMQVYVDGALKTTVNGSKIDTYVATSTGSHSVAVKAWDSSGANYLKTVSVNVTSSSGSSTGGTTTTTGGTAITNIDQMSGWESCTTCAGAGGSGPSAPYSMSHSSSPSMDGNSAHFWLGGSTPYSNALWWKQLGGKPGAHNFVYDFYFYMKTPGVSQAIEFDMNQSVNGRKLIFGTECNIAGKRWDVWDTANRRWVSTGIYCGVPPAYTWNHVVLEFQRTSGDQVKFVAVTLNGQKSYINRTFGSQGSGVQELNVAVQMDGNGSQVDYDMWVDKMKVNYW